MARRDKETHSFTHAVWTRVGMCV